MQKDALVAVLTSVAAMSMSLGFIYSRTVNRKFVSQLTDDDVDLMNSAFENAESPFDHEDDEATNR